VEDVVAGGIITPPAEHFTNVQIFPNPAKSSVLISGLNETVSVLVFDMMGRLVDSFESVQDNQTLATNWPQGMYLLKISNASKTKTQTKRLIVSK